MSESNWDAHQCNEKAGFLFDHACSQAAVVECGRCSKPICNNHFREDGNEIVCITCARDELQSLGREQKTRKRGYGRHGHWHHDDPYFYGGYHYGGWGYYGDGYWGHSHYHGATAGDAADFTEADSEALAAADIDMDAGEFESDMSES